MSRTDLTPPSAGLPDAVPLAGPAPADSAPSDQAPDRRPDASSRGSVLIFVIGVLLLLAIVATAFLGSSRSDRTATQQNSFNTQVDLLLDGVVNAAKGQITNDETVPGSTTAETFDAITHDDPVTLAPTSPNDDWLASRVPTTFDLNTPYNVTSTGDTTLNGVKSGAPLLSVASENPALWPAVSLPVLGSTFESPYRPVSSPAYNLSLQYSQRERLFPTYVSFGGKKWPAFLVDTSLPPTNNTTPGTRYQTFLAADTDGDGVADAGLFRIPVGDLSGVTYYGAVRIIDNNAAINVGTALSRDYDFFGDASGNYINTLTAGGANYPLGGVFTSNIGLAELLHSTIQSAGTLPPKPAAANMFTNMWQNTAPANEFLLLNDYRMSVLFTTGAAKTASGVFGMAGADSSPYDDTQVGSGGDYGNRLETINTPGKFPEFQYVTFGNALTSVMGDRMAQPGLSRYGGATPAYAHNLLNDGLALAAHFSLSDRNDPTSLPSTLTTPIPTTLSGQLATAILPSLTFNGVLRTMPYDGSTSTGGVDAWFAQNFNYLAEFPTNPVGTFMNRRTILTTINGVSDQTAGAVMPPAYLYQPATGGYLDPQWPDSTRTAAGTPLVNRDIQAYAPYTPSGVAIQWPTFPMYVSSVANASASSNGVTADPKVSINTGRFEELFYGYFRTMARAGFNGLANDVGTPFSTLFNGNIDTSNFANAPGVNSVLAARIPVLFDDTGTGAYAANGQFAGDHLYYSDPYIGMRFTPAITGATTVAMFADRVEPMVEDPSGGGGKRAVSVFNGQEGGTAAFEQHPLRMFRSPLRATPLRSPTAAASGGGALPITSPATATGYWNNTTPRLPADQVLILRSAIAAANLEALRDSSHTTGYSQVTAAANDRIAVHHIPLTVRGVINGNNVATPMPVVAHVYGLKRQPYITEVYANTGVTFDATGLPGNKNLQGYVAIKFYNPYNVAISLRYCRLVGLPRVTDPTLAANPVPANLQEPGQYPNMTVRDLAAVQERAAQASPTDQIDLGTAVSNVTGATYAAYVVPPMGTLVLENMPGTPGGAPLMDSATARPLSALILPQTGAVTPTDPLVNVAYVPGLQRVCWDRELVLMRPINCSPPNDAAVNGVPVNTIEYWNINHALNDAAAHPQVVDMVPLDSYDFTGLQIPRDVGDSSTMPNRTRAEIWHYVRALRNNGNTWTWVYPGRYDGDQSILPKNANNDQGPGPRQQGTVRALDLNDIPGWIEGATGNVKDPFATGDPAAAHNAYATAHPSTLATPAATTGATATYPDVFTIQLNSIDWPGNNPMHAPTAGVPNVFPYGGFRRLGDMLEAPFIGSYTIQLEPNAYAGAGSVFLEANAVTADAALAEDTDPLDNENAGQTYVAYTGGAAVDDGSQSREQIGRFLPLRPSQGGGAGYANGRPATSAFDQTVAAPNQQWSFDFDPAIDDRQAAAGTPDPFRYRDDMSDTDAIASDLARPLPINTADNAQTRAKDARVTRYQFANDLFNYFAVNTPHDDYLPNYPTQSKWQPNTYYSLGDTVQFGMNVFVCAAAHLSTPDVSPNAEISPGSAVTTTTSYTKPSSNANWVALVRTPVTNGNGTAGSSGDLLTANARSLDFYTANDTNEATQSRPGLININTAPEKVLAAVPWIPRTGAADRYTYNFNVFPPTVAAGADGIDDNAQFAHMLVLYRDGNKASGVVVPPANPLGITTNTMMNYAAATPFTSLFDLMKVPGVVATQRAILATAQPDVSEGDYSPIGGGNDNVRFDFEEQNLLVNRVSNLLTTKSDVFTLYAIVQGWRNVGTNNPQLVVQRRAAFIVDRSAVVRSATSGALVTTRIPAN